MYSSLPYPSLSHVWHICLHILSWYKSPKCRQKYSPWLCQVTTSCPSSYRSCVYKIASSIVNKKSSKWIYNHGFLTQHDSFQHIDGQTPVNVHPRYTISIFGGGDPAQLADWSLIHALCCFSALTHFPSKSRILGGKSILKETNSN